MSDPGRDTPTESQQSTPNQSIVDANEVLHPPVTPRRRKTKTTPKRSLRQEKTDPCQRCPRTEETRECPEKYEDEILCHCDDDNSDSRPHSRYPSHIKNKNFKSHKKHHKVKEKIPNSQVSFTTAPDKEYRAVPKTTGLKNPNLIPGSEKGRIVNSRPYLEESDEEIREMDTDSNESRKSESIDSERSVMCDITGKDEIIGNDETSKVYNNLEKTSVDVGEMLQKSITKYERENVDKVKKIDEDEIIDKNESIVHPDDAAIVDEDKTKFEQKIEDKSKTFDKNEIMKIESVPSTEKDEILDQDKKVFKQKTVNKGETIDKDEQIDKQESVASKEKAEFLGKGKTNIKHVDKSVDKSTMENDETIEKDSTILINELIDMSVISDKDKTKIMPETRGKGKTIPKDETIDKGESTGKEVSLKRGEILVQEKTNCQRKSKPKGKILDEDATKEKK